MKLAKCLLAGIAAAALALPAAAHEVIYETTLSGANESPANSSLGTGFARVTIDLDVLLMRVEANFSGLGSNTIAAHIHCCLVPAGPPNVGVATPVPTFPSFPLGVTLGSYDQTFDLSLASSFNPAFVTAQGSLGNALNAFLNGLSDGAAYFNIHTANFQAGEIRGNLTAVPEPQVLGLLAIALGALGAVRSRRR